jgi:hypothetical protein
VKGFKLRDPVSKKIVLSRDIVFYEQSMLKKSLVIEVSELEGGSPNREVIQVDIEPTPTNNIKVVYQQQLEPTATNHDTKNRLQ